MKVSRILHGVRVLAIAAVLAACLVTWLGCAPKAKTPPPEPNPSEVITRDGIAFYVKGLRLPGTRQELRFKEGDTLTWVPLEQVSVVRFTGPVHNSYRRAIIYLTGGEQLRGDVSVDFLIEGTTDLGYWNMPMRKVESLKMGFD